MPLRLVPVEEEERQSTGFRLVPAEPEEKPRPQIEEPTWGDAAASFPKAVVGAAETVGALATGFAAFPVSGLVQLGTLMATGDTEQAIQSGHKVADVLTYKPQSEYGKIYTNLAGKLIEIPHKIATTYGEATVERDELDDIYNELGLPTGTLSPGMATAVTTPLELFLYGAAFRPLHGAVEGRARAKNFLKNATAEDWKTAEGLIKADKPEELKSYLIKREAEVGYKAPPPPRLKITPVEREIPKPKGEFLEPPGKLTAKELAEQAGEEILKEEPIRTNETLNFLGMQSMYERARSPEMKTGIARFAEKFKEFWMPFSTVPEGGKALGLRYKAMGDIARAERFIENIHKKLDKYPDDVKADFFRYMDGQVEADVLPQEAQNLARSLRGASNRIGQMLVKRGILKREQYDAHKGQYVHYMYAKHIVGDDRPIGVRPTGKLDLSYAKSRKDLTLEQRKALGLIEDASVAVPVGMGKALSDIAKHDYLEAVGTHPEWTWQPSMVDIGEGQRMGIGKLVEEVKTYGKMVEMGAGEEVQIRFNQLNTALQQAIEQTRNVPREFEQLPNTKSYGPLAGAYLRKPIADDLKPLMGAFTDRGALLQTLVDIESQAVALFKMGKVAVNLPTATRNVGSNFIQMNMRGRPLYKIPGDVVDGATSMLKKDVYYEEAFRQGMFKTNWAATEINEILNTFSRVETGNWNSFLNAVKKVAKYYGRIDDIAKLSIYRQMREAGNNITDSTLEAMKWGMDYSLASRSVKGLRQHIMPFVSYQYKIAPLIAESLRKRPWVIGKYAAIPTIAIAAVKEMYDLDDKDWKKLEKDLPHYIKRSGTYTIMPLKSPEGKWQWVNLEYFFPWGNYYQLFRDINEREMGEVARDLGISNPFMDIFRMFASAKEDQPPKHPYYGTPIYNRLDPPYMKAAKVMEFLTYTWAPQMLSRKGALGYTEGAISGEKDKWGRSITPAQAIGRWFGINIVAVSPEQTKAIKKYKSKELRKDFYRIKADPSKTRAEKQQALKRLREELKKLR